MAQILPVLYWNKQSACRTIGGRVFCRDETMPKEKRFILADAIRSQSLPIGVTLDDMTIEVLPKENSLAITVYVIPEVAWENKHERKEYYLTPEDHEKLVRRLMESWGRAEGIKDLEHFCNTIVRNSRAARDLWQGELWINAPQSFNARLRVIGRYDILKDDFLRRYVKESYVQKINKNPPRERSARESAAGKNGRGGISEADAELGISLTPTDANWVRKRKAQLKKETIGDDISLEILAMAELKAHKQMIESLNNDNEELKTGHINSIRQMREMLGLKRKAADGGATKALAGSLDQLIKLFDSVVGSGLWDRYDELQRVEEIKMMLRKADRNFEDGTPEIDEIHFEAILGMGTERARMLLARQLIDAYDPPSEEYRKAEADLLRASRDVK